MPIKLRPFFSIFFQKLLAFVIVLLFLMQIPASAQAKKELAKRSTGIASWYSDSFEGRRTASGEIFSQKKLTCASNQYKIGTWLRVTNTRNGKSVVVKVNDRMGKSNKRIVDLTRTAAKKIGLTSHGLAKVSIEKMGN